MIYGQEGKTEFVMLVPA